MRKPKPWPTFVPLDVMVTCRGCNEPWDAHGMDSAHCPPCGKSLRTNKHQAWTEGYCNKVRNHGGKCADVVDKNFSKNLKTILKSPIAQAIANKVYGFQDKYGRSWPGFNQKELCPTCGQPDSCGDCNHKRLSKKEVLEIGGTL